jgi:ankyrin repeat protein
MHKAQYSQEDYMNVLKLLTNQSTVNASTRGPYRFTPLKAAVYFEQVPVVEFLLNNGAEVTEKVMQDAQEHGNEQIIKLLEAKKLES